MIKLASTADGASVDALSNESRLVEIGGPMMPQELTEQLVGMKAGDEKEFDFTTEFDPSLAGKTIHTTVTVKEVREKETPELDDEFAKKVGFDTFDELVEQLKNEITSTKAEQLPRLKESRCVTELSHRIKGDIPDAYLDYTRENILRDFFNSLQEQGTTFDQFLSSRGITGEQFREDLEAQAREEAEECLGTRCAIHASRYEHRRGRHREGVQRRQQSGGHAQGVGGRWPHVHHPRGHHRRKAGCVY